MSKASFSRLSSLVNGVTAINGVISEIESAFDNTVSRDGTSPNTLTASLDANSQRILNLPSPVDGTEPARLSDLQDAQVSGTFVLPLLVTKGGTGATTAAAARTNLGLGTAAVLNTGTSANNIVQLDASARIPAVNGSLLTNLSGANVTGNVNIGVGTGTSIDLSSGKFVVDANGNVTSTLGFFAKGTFGGTFTDGTVVDYALGNARISTGPSDTISFYNNGVANTLLGQISTGGTYTATDGLLAKGTTGVGYTTGAGGTVTQLTSRNTGVTLNKLTGSITLFTAVPGINRFVVTNSTVAATDTVVVSIKSANAANIYIASVAAVAAGSFTVDFLVWTGTTSDAPVLNFTVIKGVTA